ncbi:MAG: 2-phospho-L-lactate transferase [Kiloniellaceae bacterium]
MTRQTTTACRKAGAAVRAGKGGNRPVLALCGGVGGAKLALGLYRALAPDELTVVANTGDDFEHLGLHVSPDIDTVLYTLAGLANPRTGWGRSDETWTFMSALEALGGETWFRLGDGDLALHVLRTAALKAGQSLSAVCGVVCRRLGIRARVLPMSDDPVRTVVQTDGGPLPFQHYFVKLKCAPRVAAITFEGAATAKPHPAFMEALSDPRLRAVVICPSNPYLSIGPILAVPGVREALAACCAPVVAVSPIVGGRAVKGPTAKIMEELGVPRTPAAVARHYEGLLDGFVLDQADGDKAARAIPSPSALAQTVMTSLEDRIALAREVLAFAERIDTRTRGAGTACKAAVP